MVTLDTTEMKLPWLGISASQCIYRFYWVLRLNTTPLTALSCIGDCFLECRNQGFLIAGTRFVIMQVISHYCPNHIHWKSLLVHQAIGFATLSTLKLVNMANPHSFFIRIGILESTSKETWTFSLFCNEKSQWCLSTNHNLSAFEKFLLGP